MSPTTARARVREELTREIKEAARAELAESGAGALSLRAVARRMEMVPSALYRYFDSRDALLTALVIDAYRAIATVATEADERAGSEPAGRWVAVGGAVRSWAWKHPSEWSLVYGAPVPDYAAPADTVEPGTAVARLLARIVLDAHPDGAAPDLPVTTDIPPELGRWVAIIRSGLLPDVEDAPSAVMNEQLVVTTVMAWTYLIGAISLELFGQFGKGATPAAAMFDAGLHLSAAMLALPGGG
jgi:AcrR family transcriptional regulator